MSKKTIEKKYKKLKMRHELLKDVLRVSMKILREQNSEIRKKTLLEKGKPIELPSKPETKSVTIELGLGEEWLNPFLKESANGKGDALKRFFADKLNSLDIKYKDIVSVHGVDKAWTVNYTPFEEPKQGTTDIQVTISS